MLGASSVAISDPNQWIAENNKKARSCSQDLVGAAPRSRRVAASMPTHQVSQNRCFLEAQRPHHRRRVRLPTQSRCRSEGDCGDKRPPGATTKRRAAPPSTGLVECTGKSPPSLQSRRPPKQFSDCRPSAPIPCLRIPTAGASEHQESNSHLPRGKGGWYLYQLLVCQVW